MASVEKQLSDLDERIDEIDRAIQAAVSGASYSIGGRTLTRQNIPELRDERTRLVRERKQVLAVRDGATSPGVAVASWYR